MVKKKNMFQSLRTKDEKEAEDKEKESAAKMQQGLSKKP